MLQTQGIRHRRAIMRIRRSVEVRFKSRRLLAGQTFRQNIFHVRQRMNEHTLL